MMGYGASSSESTEGEEAVEAPGPPPEPRAPEPRAPEPEPGLDLSLSPSPLPESPKRRDGGPGRRKGRRGGSRRGRQVSGGEARLELRSARAAAAHFDAARAVEERLRKSFRARCALEETVAEGLNVPRSRRLYRDLVSLQVPEEQVLSAALQEKLAMLPPQPRAPPPKEVLTPGPDMTMLCNPDSLCYESPHLAVDALPALRLQARPRPSEDTFLMHRMLRRWEA
ncbi:protein phosphatase 1 regulatory subunit 35 [Psammomys obesus]|uniref:protein phosphatase 1 regulatory subunit 35 n=1 Tax=Psammomys obesus TaxID=48139 RepID=UPI002452D038|nr:protein phosphatase 1 regulatory subunit 35 [Psammomys obesus]